MLACPSICPPERKNTSTRPWPAQSKSSRPPSEKKLSARLPSTETYVRPLPRARHRIAASAGIGEALPTATWRASPISPAITFASSSSLRKFVSGGAPLMDVPIEIAGETLGRRGELGVFGQVRRVGGVMVRQRQRPGAARRDRDRFQIKAAERAGGEQRILEQICLVQFLDRDDRLGGGVRHQREVALLADPHVAVAVGEWRVEQR